MSFLTASSSRTWLPILGIIEEDPYRSRNTVAHARSSHRPRLYRESQYVRGIGEGAVFQVSLYEHKGVQFAVKKAKATPQSEKHGLRAQAATGTLVALQEIQVVSSAVLRRHPNIIDIFGWDWDHDGLPVLFTNYAELGTLQDFLRSQTQYSLTMAQRRSFALNVACGLHALHATNVAHGDIKLANTLVYPDPRMPKSFIVKVSDFSHSVFGLSSRRITSYPGSALYNAPEVRSRYALIPSDRLPRCESYSFGLLAWEILKNGTSYFEETWSNRLSTLVAGKTSEYSHVDLLHEFRPDEILELSVQYLHSFYQMQASCYDFHIFNRVFQMTLKDNPSLRKDMGQIAATLDYCDE